MTKSTDKYNLKTVILNYLDKLSIGKEFAKNIKPSKKSFQNIIICGMGGSALPGEILSAYLSHEEPLSLPVIICRDYVLPKIVSKNSLIFIASYSGNTEETISCFKEALKLKSQIVAFSEGGEVEKMAKKAETPHVKFSSPFPHFQPRYAAVYAFVAMHTVLRNAGIVKKTLKFPKIKTADYENSGKELARKIKDKTPIIYSSDALKILGLNWKIKINENSKTPAFWNYFPELNHNEMVGFTNPRCKFFVIMLQNPDDNPKTKRRMEITAKLYKQKGLGVEVILIKGKSFMEKLLNGLALGDWVSYYLAIGYQEDPTPVKMVEDLKKELK